MPPRVVVFDLGKVLVDFDYGLAAQRIAACALMSAAEVQRVIDHCPLLFRFERGEMTNQEFYHEVCATTGFTGSYEEFASFFADIFTPMEPMIQLHRQICARKLSTFILSNTNDIAIGLIRRKFPFFANFDGYVLSYQHGVMKPDAKIYQVLESLAAAKGAEILFLDDREENVAAAAERGWQVIHHQSVQSTQTRLLLECILNS